MARRIRSADLETRSARLRLPIRPKPYATKIARGLHLLYRRNKTTGTWAVRVVGNEDDWVEQIGLADDYNEANGHEVFDYWQAQDRARKRAQGGRASVAGSLGNVLDQYKRDLEARGGEVRNAARARGYIPKRLRDKSAGTLTAADFRDLRDAIAAKVLPATVARIVSTLKAALALAEKLNGLPNRKAWTDGLETLPDTREPDSPRPIADGQVKAIVAAAYKISTHFGEYIEVLAVTGTRPSQAERLQGDDVQAGAARLLMPSSRKGQGRKIRRVPVPIPNKLAERLSGRTGALLLQPDRTPWTPRIRGWRFRAAVEAAGFDPDEITPYALRHSSIIRQLLAHVPIRLVAVVHDTSVAMIEKTYSRYIAHQGDEVVRAAMLETSAEIVSLDERRSA
jgi:integrase